MTMREIQLACRKAAQFPGPDTLFNELNKHIAALLKNKSEDLIPRLVLSHGFMEWEDLLGSKFPCLMWRGKKIEGGDYHKYQKLLYDRFFLRIVELPSLKDMTDKDKEKLKKNGWESYITD